MAPLLKIAVMCEEVQFMDVAGLDLLGNCSTDIVKASPEEIAPGAQERLLPHAKDIEWYFLATTLDKPMRMSFIVSTNATHTYDQCPRDIDILLIGGPMPSHRPESSLKFLCEMKPGVVLATCTGGMWLASAGILDGKKATTNREVLGMAKKFHPDVEWVDQRYVIDGKFWTAGGAQAGIDMVAEYVKHAFHPDLAAMSLAVLDVDPTARGQFYKT